MAPGTSDNRPRISLPVFRRMLGNLTVAELRRLPLESLPDEIPLDVIEEAPAELRPALEELSFALGSRQLGRWGEDADRFGEEVAAALGQADQHRPQGRVEALERAVAELADEWRDWSRRSDANPREFVDRIARAEPLAGELRQEGGQLMQALARIDAALESHGRVERLSEARARLARELGRVEAALGGYHALNLAVARREMRLQRERIDVNAFEDEEIGKRLDVLQRRLERSQSVLRRGLRPKTARRERERLQQRISELMNEREAREWVIAEADMTRWLDAVVDASLHARDQNQEQVLREGRLQLYQLLNLFCRQQEDAAKRIAQNPFMQLDPQQAIEFLLISERFIVGYFAEKRNDLTRWLGGAAQQKLHELDKVQSGILDEYRRHRKRQ